MISIFENIVFCSIELVEKDILVNNYIKAVVINIINPKSSALLI